MRVDFSAEAVRQACEHTWRLGRTAGLPPGNLAATGLGDGSVDAVLCVDAIQFSQQPDAAYCELPQVLGSDGRAVLTCLEAPRPGPCAAVIPRRKACAPSKSST
jgi:presenilin-like A22 family membrane protease